MKIESNLKIPLHSRGPSKNGCILSSISQRVQFHCSIMSHSLQPHGLQHAWPPCCYCCKVTSVRSDSVWLHRRQPTKLPCPWDFWDKNTGVVCHFLLQCMKVKSESEVTQLCPTLRPHWLQPTRLLWPGVFQARVLEWGAIAFSEGIQII